MERYPRWSDQQIWCLFKQRTHVSCCLKTFRACLDAFSKRYGVIRKPMLGRPHRLHRWRWCVWAQSVGLPNHRIAYLDEKWFLQRSHGSVRLVDPQAQLASRFTFQPKQGQIKVMLICCICLGVPPLVVEVNQNINCLTFIQFCHRHLFPWMRAHQISTVQMDRAPAHKAQLTLDYWAACGFRLLLQPSNSPDLQPCEKVFAHGSRLLDEKGMQDGGVWGKQKLSLAARQAFSKAALQYQAAIIQRLPKTYEAVIHSHGGNAFLE